MKLRNRMLAIVGLTIVITLLVAYPIMQTWMTGKYQGLEDMEVTDEVRHTQNGIGFELATLRSAAADYAIWDDTCKFLQGGHPGYVDSNFADSTFLNLRLNVVVIADSADRIAYSRSFGYTVSPGDNISESLAAELRPGSPLLMAGADNGTTGFLSLPEGLLMISASPILRSDRTGPREGTMVMGRYVNEAEIDTIGSIAGTTVSLVPRSEATAAPADSDVRITAIDENTIYGDTTIYDVYGKPAAVLSVSVSRPIYRQGQQDLIFVTICVICGLILLGAMITLLLERSIISPLLRVNGSVARIGRDRDPAGRVPVEGRDEIAGLAIAINGTLESMDQAGRKLHDSELKFRSLVENVSDVVWETDADLRFTYVSPRSREVAGYDPGVLLGKTPYDLMPKDQGVRQMQLAIDQIAGSGAPVRVEITALRPDGTPTELEVNSSAITGPEGQITGYRGIARDISERKRAEEALRESEERMRLCAAAARFGTHEWDIPNDRHIWSAETYKIFGIPPGTPITLARIRDVIYPGDQREEVFAAGLDPGGPGEYSMEYRIIRPSDGAIRWVYLKARVHFAGEGRERHAVRALGAVMDITERRQAEEVLRESVERFRAVFDRSAVGIAVADHEGYLVDSNPVYQALLGYAKEELQQKCIYDVTYGEDRDKCRELERQLRDGTIDKYQVEKRYVRKDGRIIWGILNVTTIRNPDGSFKYNLGVLEDVTDRKQAEEAMAASLQEKEVLLKEIHHRVKNNLQIISSLLSLQSENINSDDPASSFRVSQDRIRSMALIHEKLYQSKDISRIDFAGYVRSLTSYLSHSYAAGHSVSITVDIEGVSLGIDRAIPCGLIINELASNALKYAFPEGRSGELRIGLAQDRDRYTLTVSDNGAGLPPGLDFRNTASLGLQLVNTLVSQLEGTIELDSSRGTAFTIVFAQAKPGSVRNVPP